VIEWLRELFRRYPTHRSVVVNTTTDRAFKGVLWRQHRRYLVLRNAYLLKAKGESVSVDGEVVIERDKVDFVQVL
jgi:hypothetical protein